MNKVLTVAAIAALAVSANAITVGNARNASIGAGRVSDALVSNAGYFYGRALGEKFTLAANANPYTLTKLTWWGRSEGFSDTTDANVTSFQVAISSASPLPSNSGQLIDLNLVQGSLTKTIEGTVALTAGQTNVYRYEWTNSNPSIGLVAGTYAIHIGGVLADGTNGDAWFWHRGATGDNAFFQRDSNTAGTAWDNWTEISNQSTDLAYLADFEAVPEPATMIALGSIAAYALRRKRA
jgi:hypothetical protein